jgi:hypothetical protein
MPGSVPAANTATRHSLFRVHDGRRLLSETAKHGPAKYRHQYKLIKRGIDSARLTTDSGIDLVMYIPGTTEAHTVQVKTIVNPFLDGGTGPLVAGWVLPRTCKAQWLAGHE